MSFRFVVTEALRSLRASLFTTAAATVTILVGMLLLGSVLALTTYLRSYSGNLKGDLLVKVFFQTNPPPTAQQLNRVRFVLESDPRVESVVFVPAEEALRRMQKRFPKLTENISGGNPFPAGFEVKPMRGEDTKLIARAIEQKKLAGVGNVTYKEEITRRVILFSRAVGIVSAVAILLLLAAATVLIATTIRLSIFARRREIEVMKLVGASNWFVRGPFVLEGLLCGVVGAASAIALLLVGKLFVVPAIGWFDSGDARAWPFPLIAATLLGLSVLLSAAGSGLTLRRFLQV